jgi:hypothetical protein
LTPQTSLTWWTRDKGGGVVEHAELSAERLALEIAFDNQIYSVVLTPSPQGPAAWRGAWTLEGKPGTGAVAARLSRSADGAFALIGEWNEDATVYRWVAEFQAAR